MDLTLWFYQNGIMRALLEEPGSGRFRISQEGLPVVDEQLEIVDKLSYYVNFGTDHVNVGPLLHSDESETFSYKIKFDHF